MRYDPDRHHRRSVRLRGYDYAASGAYFVTVCLQDRACRLSDIVSGKTALTDAGQMVETAFRECPERFHHVRVDAFVIMPDHVHGIIVIGSGPMLVGAALVAAPVHDITGAAMPAPTSAPIAAPMRDVTGAAKQQLKDTQVQLEQLQKS